MISGDASASKTGLSAELLEFLVEFSIALHRTSMYPPGHPSQEKSAAGVVQRLVSLLGDRSSVSIGIARQQIVIEGVASDARHPVLRSLAEKFHRQHIGAVVFERGITAAELAAMMQLIAVASEKGGRPLALEDPEALRQWAGVRLYPMTYDQLELVGAPEEEDELDKEQREQGTRSAQLWVGLARAALAARESGGEQENDPNAVAQAINDHPAAQAYDQVVVGYLLEIAQSLKQDGGKMSEAVRRRMSRLINALDASTLKRLVEMGGDLEQRRQFVLDATDSLSVDAVVEIVRSAAETSGETISNSLMRLLTKLSSFAEGGSAELQRSADVALRDQVHDLISNWSLKDPNPDAYTRALQSMAADSAAIDAGRGRRLAQHYAPEPQRIMEMALEVDAAGPVFWRAVNIMEKENRIGDIVPMLLAASPGNSVAQLLWKRFATEANLRALLAREPADFEIVNPLLDHLDETVAMGVLLDTLAESESRGTRMGVFRRIVSMGPKHADELVKRMSAERPLMLRNMLAIFNEMQHTPDSVSPADYTRHTDVRVRREALQLCLRIPKEREQALLLALKEADDRALRVGVAALRDGVPESAVPIITSRLADKNLSTDIRLQLVRALTQVNSTPAMSALINVVVTGKTFLGAPKFADTSPVLLVALGALAEKWRDDATVQRIMKRARKSRDRELSAAIAKARSA